MVRTFMRTFFFTKDVPIMLYGENDFAMCTLLRLKQRGYNVRGIIDQKYDHSREEDGVMKCSLADLGDWKQLVECIIIICLKNGMIHEKVADSLYNMGVRKIIYLPMHSRNAIKERESCRAAWRHIWSFEYEKVGPVPYYSMEVSPVMVIESGKRWISFWCPSQYLRSATIGMIQKDVPESLKEAKAELKAYADVTIEEHKPYIELFEWLGGKKADINLYLKAMGRTTEQEREKLLLDRKELYIIYEQALHYDMAFFSDAPAQVSWNAGGYFNVIDGMHRIQYLYKKGYREMPVIACREEYELFLKKAGYKK